MADRRYLLGILVYNGLEVVKPCLRSAATLVASDCDVVVFDDCSPSPGWSDEVEAMCGELGIGYYRSPRNLGIPRNMSLVMRTALDGAYDVAGLVNSDVVLPANLLLTMNAAFDAGTDIASVTPWSNNVSLFSLPMDGATPPVADVGFVTKLSTALHEAHAGDVLEIPSGVGYCLMVATAAIREVGVMDPIFGRGYCEEVDWCQRAVQAGYRNVLSLGCFVYHAGSGTNRDEGLLAHGMTTVLEHDEIIRWRYPDYESRLIAFQDRREVERLGPAAIATAFESFVLHDGATLVIADLTHATDNAAPTIHLSPTASRSIGLSMLGMTATIEFGSPWNPEQFEARFGLPTRVVVGEPGLAGREFSDWARAKGIPLEENISYPTRV